MGLGLLDVHVYTFNFGACGRYSICHFEFLCFLSLSLTIVRRVILRRHQLQC